MDGDGQSATGIWKSDEADKNGVTTFLIILNGKAQISDFTTREEFVKTEYGVQILVRKNIKESEFYPKDYMGELSNCVRAEWEGIQGEVLYVKTIAEPASNANDEPAVKKEAPKKVFRHFKRKRK